MVFVQAHLRLWAAPLLRAALLAGVIALQYALFYGPFHAKIDLFALFFYIIALRNTALYGAGSLCAAALLEDLFQGTAPGLMIVRNLFAYIALRRLRPLLRAHGSMARFLVFAPCYAAYCALSWALLALVYGYTPLGRTFLLRWSATVLFYPFVATMVQILAPRLTRAAAHP